jgi:hypothetical protein
MWLRIALVALLMAGCADAPQAPVKSPADSGPQELVQQVAEAYRTRDVDLLRTLLADDAELPDYLFLFPVFDEPLVDSWGLEEELRIHERIFDPTRSVGGASPVPPELWVTSITITLTQQTAFVETTDFYASPDNPDGLSPDVWKVVEAIYGTDVLFDLQGEIDYHVGGLSRFVVVEDLRKPAGAAGTFLILRWEELPQSRAALAAGDVPWSKFKSLYY